MKKITRPVGTFAYVPKSERALPESERSSFMLRPMTQAERLVAYDTLSTTELRDDGTRIARSFTWQQARDICLAHIVEVRNFPSDAPNEPWPAGEAQRLAYLEGIDEFVLLEVATAVRDASSASESAGN